LNKKEKPNSADEDDPLQLTPEEEVGQFKFNPEEDQNNSEPAAESSGIALSDSADANPHLGNLGSFISTQAALPQQAPTLQSAQTSSLHSQTTHFFHIPPTLQIQVPVAVAGTSLDLSQVGAQQIILTNFDFNTMNNLQF